MGDLYRCSTDRERIWDSKDEVWKQHLAFTIMHAGQNFQSRREGRPDWAVLINPTGFASRRDVLLKTSNRDTYAADLSRTYRVSEKCSRCIELSNLYFQTFWKKCLPTEPKQVNFHGLNLIPNRWINLYILLQYRNGLSLTIFVKN